MAKFITVKDVRDMKIPLESPIEMLVHPNRKSESELGGVEERQVVYYMGQQELNNYDRLRFYRVLSSDVNAYDIEGINLQLVSNIKVLN